MNDWYKDAVFYELHVKAFYDSNADGVGDFRGLIEKLDYLEGLGVDCPWLLPFYRSPLRDDGYDTSDYGSILPKYGDVEQFRLFLHPAHKRGLRVMTELVLNHTSDQHPWFREARASRSSPKREHVVAFARRRDDAEALVVVPRWTAALPMGPRNAPLNLSELLSDFPVALLVRGRTRTS